MIFPINQLPDDVLRLVFLEVANPKIAKVCKKWSRLNSDPSMIKFYLQRYEATLGKILYGQLIQRMHGWEFTSCEGFKRLLRRQWALNSQFKNGIKLAEFSKTPLCTEKIKLIESRIAENMELDLYAFCVQLLTKREIHLQDEAFVEGMKLLIWKIPSKDRLKAVWESKMGTHFWDLILKNIDLGVVRELTLDSSLLSIPIQIVHLVGLESLSLPDKRSFCIPGDILKLTHLKILDLGRNKGHYLAPELVESNNPVIKASIDSWRKTTQVKAIPIAV